jgi:hypothetical protein
MYLELSRLHHGCLVINDKVAHWVPCKEEDSALYEVHCYRNYGISVYELLCNSCNSADERVWRLKVQTCHSSHMQQITHATFLTVHTYPAFSDIPSVPISIAALHSR